MADAVIAPANSGEFIAYEVSTNGGYELVPAPVRRQWMDDFPHKVPYRCLPMSIANQAGWIVTAPASFRVQWNGKHTRDALKVTFTEKLDQFQQQVLERAIGNNFGGGILTFRLPWIFRTPEGIGLWVHGAPNAPVDNAYALDGIVETDWLCAGFTVNWKITKRNTPVFFQKGDPVCMLTPYPLDLLESLAPKQKLVTAEPELHDAFRAAADRRNQTLQRTAESGEKHFELDYMHGRDEEGHKRQGHRTNVKLAAFEDERLSSNGQS